MKGCPLKIKKRKLRIGIYAGAFNPVHAGHISFALQAKEASGLDQIIFLPERKPRHKPSVEHYAHRVAMLKAALAIHPDLAVMEVVDRHFTVHRMLPLLASLFPDADYVFLMGSDTFMALPNWTHADRLMQVSEFVVGIRSEHELSAVEHSVSAWKNAPNAVMIFNSFSPGISSSRIRQALRTNQHTEGLLSSVRRYARQEWLYVSPGSI